MTLISSVGRELKDLLLPIPFWAEAVNTACYVQNKVLVTKPHNKTLSELLHGRTPSIGFMRPFGCHVTILNTLDSLGKFNGKVDERFLVRYSVSSKAFRVFNSRTRIVQETLHVNFLENKPNVVDAAFDEKELEFDEKKHESEVNVSPSSKFKDFSDNSINEVNAAGTLVPTVGQISSISTNTFSAAELEDITYSDDEDDVGTEANFNNLETSITEEGIDYEEVFTLVARIEAIRLFLAYASLMGFMVYQMDVKSAFLYGTIKEEVYVCQPSGFEDTDYPDKKKDGIFISQDKYVAEILKKFRLTDEKSTSTPIDTEKTLLKGPDGEDVDVHTYISMIGSLMYLTSSRPDIMFAVCACVCFQVTPKASHLHAVKRIFRYLKGKPHLGLWYPKYSPFDLVAYSDSDYAGASLDRKSTTGGVNTPRCDEDRLELIELTVFLFLSDEKVGVKVSAVDLQVFAVRLILLLLVQKFLLFALLDKKKVVVTEATIRDILRLDDAKGVECLPNEEIFADLARMGYEKPSTKLTFYKEFFSSQWKFLIHTILLGRNVDSPTKFYMYPRFLQLMIRKQVGKRFSGVETPLFEGMVVAQEVGEGVTDEMHDEGVHVAGIVAEGDGRIIADIDKDADVVLEEAKDVGDDTKDDQDAEEEESELVKLQEVVDIVTTAKIITEVVTAASTTITAADVLIPAATTTAALKLTVAPSKRIKGVVIRDPEESTSTTSTIIHSEAKSKDNGKRILVEEPKPLKKQAQIEQEEKYARELETKEQIDEEESRALKRKNKTPAEKLAKRKKLREEIEELKRHLQIVPNKDDDVYTDATPLARKVPVVDYEIYNENNKPYYKIIRADGTHQLYISFLSLLRNFDKEDLEALRSLVKERFATAKPKNFSNDFLLMTLEAMFEKPDIHAQF
uniref:Uncharacterized mitochondrial protein AtMg00810-like n=1 Tax=Tanacetum cinerariifolium TaxID=118510 RepID=A0A699HAT1_TANCI|nr:uncharacterized mitochondrial protein AtMg00810-like [Tanacetum cinerariifolium]